MATATNTFSVTRKLPLSRARVDIAGQKYVFTVAFTDATSGVVKRERDYTVDISGNVTDDEGNAMPAAQAGLKIAILGGGATLGLIPETNAYISTNAASFVE